MTEELIKICADCGTIISGIASLVGIPLLYYTFKSQKHELKITQRALVLQKGEMEKQNTTLSIQLFENTFFQLLSFHNEIVKSLKVDITYNEKYSTVINTTEPMQIKNKEVVTGREVISLFFEDFTKAIEDIKLSKSIFVTKEEAGDKLKKIKISDGLYYAEYSTQFSYYQNELAHYFRSLYQIVRLIDEEEIPNKNKYIRILRGQLNTTELLVLFYNCLSDLGKDFKLLIENYSLFKAINKSLLFDSEHIDLYEKGAYGE